MSSPNGAQTILLVEDDNLDVVLFIRAFAGAGAPFRLITVRDGEEAIKYLDGMAQYADREKWPQPALVLLDLHILRLDGFAVLRWMREQKTPMPPAIIHSSSTNDDDKALALKLGAKEYAVKHDSLEALTVWIKTLETKLSQWAQA